MPATAQPSANLRERLKSVRSALEEKRGERASLVKARDEAKEKFASSPVPVTELTQSEDFKAAEQAVKALGECDDTIADLQVAEVGVLQMLGDHSPVDPRGNGPTDVARHVRGWNPESVLQGSDYKALIESGIVHSTQAAIGSRNLGSIADRETAAAFLGGRSAGGFMAADVGSDEKQGAIPADRRGIISPNLKPLTLLDLIPTGTTDSNLVEYVQVLTIPGQAAETAEGELKPEASFTTLDKDAPVRTIAGWIKARKQALADVAGLRTLLNTLLPYDVRRRIESQMLVGDGTGQNLEGILQMDGVHQIAAEPGDNLADAILRVITAIVLVDGDPNFTALNPLSWQELLLMRENQAERTGQYLYGSPSSPAAPTIWGLNITKNRVVPAGEPLIGDSMSATLLVREGVNVLASDSDGDDFRRNRVTILAESRVAFPVWRPTNFGVAVMPGSGSGS